MRYDFLNIADRSEVSASKTDADFVKGYLGVNYYEDTIPMWVADMDFVVAPEIVEAIKRRAEMATFGYSGFSEGYYGALISWFKRRHGAVFSSADVVYNNGTVSATRNIIRAFTKEGEGVIIQPPVYYPFKSVTLECDRTVVENHLIKDNENRYSIDFEDFEAKCAEPNNKLFIFCNPHNPVGQIWDKATAQRLLDICRENGVLFFSDEVHADIVRKGVRFTSSLNLDNSDDIIVATAVNKTFNLAGLHITNLIIRNPELRQRLNRYTGGIQISPLAEAATIAAYDECEEWVDEMNDVVDGNLLHMKEFIGKYLPKVRYNLPEATYLAWLDLRAYDVDESELIKLCADEAHLILEGGSMFGDEGRGFIRINVACPKALLEEALDRLNKLLKTLD